MVRNTIERIRAHLREPGITKKGLAEQAGLHPNTLQGVDDDRWNPSASTLIALERQLPVTGSDCVHDAADTVINNQSSFGKADKISGPVLA